MQDSLNSKQNDEIDLRELFMTLWAYKFLIAFTCTLSLFYSIYYIQNAEKIYTSTAIFKLDESDTSGFSMGSNESAALASIAGIGVKQDTNTLNKDQLAGRIFIKKLDAQLNFLEDPYFNSYNPNSVDPVWKSFIKRAIGWQKSSVNVQEAIWQRIVSNYNESVVLEETDEMSSIIKVSHVNPQRAAEIANEVMSTIISSAKAEKARKQDERLNYLSNTLAKALSDLEVAQTNLKEFTLDNSALPLETFTAGSIVLGELRKQLKRTNELYEAMAALLIKLQNDTVSQDDYLELRQQFPIVDQLTFRRVLGQSEMISSWSWPKASSVEVVFNTLSERKNRLQSQIDAIQIDAERSGTTLDTFAKLEREAKVSEATYTVLMEQVKAQSMVAGYRPVNSEIYEYASTAITHSEPKRNKVVSLGIIIGLFVGIVLSFVLARFRGVYYSRNSLKACAQAQTTFSVRSLLPLRDKSLNDVNAMIVKKPLPILRDMAMEIHKSDATQIVVTSSRSKILGFDTARALASYMQSENMKIAVINFSSSAKTQEIDCKKITVGPFVVTESANHVSVMKPDGDLIAMELLGQRHFWENIQSLNSTFDLVFLSADNSDALSLLSALEGQKAFHITLARIRKTKSIDLTEIRSRFPIQGLFHD
jgi:uncharacterized protein involved in exopolysaccharide biosynthesis